MFNKSTETHVMPPPNNNFSGHLKYILECLGLCASVFRDLLLL